MLQRMKWPAIAVAMLTSIASASVVLADQSQPAMTPQGTDMPHGSMMAPSTSTTPDAMMGGDMTGMMNMMMQMSQMMETCNKMMQTAMQSPGQPQQTPGQTMPTPQKGG